MTRFQERSAAASDVIVAVERPFSVRIGGDRVRGRYDVVRQTDDGIVITDYKSGDMRDPTRARQRARSSLQLQLYAHGLGGRARQSAHQRSNCTSSRVTSSVT